MSDTLLLDLDNSRVSTAGLDGMCLEFDPQLIEQALYLAVAGTDRERAYQTAREGCYLERDAELRDRAFAQLERDWFVKLDIARPVIKAWSEWPDIMTRIGRCVFAPCTRRQDESAELYGRPGRITECASRPNLLIRLHPDSFRRPAHIQRLLRHELMHINDMLDPDFQYDPSLSQFYDETGIPNAIRDRYRVLWNTCIDGRLSGKGLAEPSTRSRRFWEFCPPFRMLGTRAPEAFNWIFDAPALTHPEILGFARTPLSLLQHLDSKGQQV